MGAIPDRELDIVDGDDVRLSHNPICGDDFSISRRSDLFGKTGLILKSLVLMALSSLDAPHPHDLHILTTSTSSRP